MNDSRKELGYYFAKYRFVNPDDNTCSDVISFIQNLNLRYVEPEETKVRTFKIKDLDEDRKNRFQNIKFIPVTNFLFLKIKKSFLKRNTYNVKICPNIAQYDIRGNESEWFFGLPQNTQIEEAVYWENCAGRWTVHELSERLSDDEFIQYMKDRASPSL